MLQIAGYILSYSDAHAMMDRLEIPDRGVEDIRLKYPINDWLAKTKRYSIVCMSDGHMFNVQLRLQGREGGVPHRSSLTSRRFADAGRRMSRRWLRDTGTIM